MPPIVRSKPADRFARFAKASDIAKPRIVAAVYGEAGGGKTSFCLGAPGPIIVQTLDMGLEGVVEPYVKAGKEIYVAGYDMGLKVGEEFTHEMSIEARNKFIEDFEQGILSGARTIIWDRETDMWDLFCFAENGTTDKFAAAKPKEWEEQKRKIRRLIAMAKASDVNFLLTQGMSNVWAKSINPGTGKETSTPSGERKRAGMEGIDALVHINVEAFRQDNDGEATRFYIKVGKSRGPGCRDVQGQTFEMVSPDLATGDPGFGFKDFAMRVFPDSTDDQWA